MQPAEVVLSLLADAVGTRWHELALFCDWLAIAIGRILGTRARDDNRGIELPRQKLFKEKDRAEYVDFKSLIGLFPGDIRIALSSQVENNLSAH